MSETARFIVEVAREGGMRRFSQGFKGTAKVRLLHAHTRRLLLRSDYWSLRQWGMPINQVYLAGTNVMFAGVFIRGLRKLGMQVSDSEAEDLVHLWRFIGQLIGICPQLCACSMAEGDRLFELLEAVIAPPDADSIALIRALMQTPQTMARDAVQRTVGKLAVPLVYAVSRYLVGDQTADALGYPKPDKWQRSVPALRATLRALSLGQRLAPRSLGPRLDGVVKAAGSLAWEGMIDYGLRGLPE